MLIGDPNQLPAVVKSSFAKAMGADESVMERVMDYFARHPDALGRGDRAGAAVPRAPRAGLLAVTRVVPDQASLGVEPGAASALARLVGARRACRDPKEPRERVAVRAKRAPGRFTPQAPVQHLVCSPLWRLGTEAPIGAGGPIGAGAPIGAAEDFTKADVAPTLRLRVPAAERFARKGSGAWCAGVQRRRINRALHKLGD